MESCLTIVISGTIVISLLVATIGPKSLRSCIIDIFITFQESFFFLQLYAIHPISTKQTQKSIKGTYTNYFRVNIFP